MPFSNVLWYIFFTTGQSPEFLPVFEIAAVLYSTCLVAVRKRALQLLLISAGVLLLSVDLSGITDGVEITLK